MTKAEAEALAARYNKHGDLVAIVVRTPFPASIADQLEPSDDDNWFDVEVTITKED